MCIAIYTPKKAALKKEILKNCWLNNNDGAGILYIEDGVLKVYKEMNNFDTFFKNYTKIRNKNRGTSMVLHFRISTHGKVNETNCHPFLVNESLGFVHNGMIDVMPRNVDFSDTYMFNELVLKKLPQDFTNNDAIMSMMHSYIGYSKLIFLDDKDDVTIVGEEKGEWVDGCWFSNTTYKYSNYIDYGGKKVYKGYGHGWQDDWEDEAWPAKKSTAKTAKDVNDFSLAVGCKCVDCGVTLYEWEKEEYKDTCQSCIAAEKYNYSDSPYNSSTCDGCREKKGEWNSELHSYVCSECKSMFA
jgi:hypothetical protein